MGRRSKIKGRTGDHQRPDLYLMGARYYDPALGRFITQDTWEGRTWEPWTKNLYAYGRGNPVNYVDPTGHASFLADYDPSIDLQLLQLKGDYANATTDEQRAAIAKQADELRAANKGKYTVEANESLDFYLTGAGGPAAGLLAMSTTIALDPGDAAVLGLLMLLAARAVQTSTSAADTPRTRY